MKINNLNKSLIGSLVLVLISSSAVFADNNLDTQTKTFQDNVNSLKNSIAKQNTDFPQIDSANLPKGYKNTNANSLYQNTFRSKTTITPTNNIPPDSYFQNKANGIKGEQNIVEIARQLGNANIQNQKDNPWTNPAMQNISALAKQFSSVVDGASATNKAKLADTANLAKPAGYDLNPATLVEPVLSGTQANKLNTINKQIMGNKNVNTVDTSTADGKARVALLNTQDSVGSMLSTQVNTMKYGLSYKDTKTLDALNLKKQNGTLTNPVEIKEYEKLNSLANAGVGSKLSRILKWTFTGSY